MMNIQTNELIGPALDWAVAKCQGIDVCRDPDGIYLNEGGEIGFMYRPSTDWAHGGPIIEREGMHVDCLRQADHYRDAVWEAWPYVTGTKHIQQGPTPLVAAMRCYVASCMGGTVDVPDELAA